MFNYNKVCAATKTTPPATVWQGSHYTASIKEIEALRREFGLDIRMLEKHLVPRYKCSQPQASARNKLVNYSESKRFCYNKANDSTLTVRTDWILRYSECKENFHPWSQDSFKKRFAQFDLVPWRKCRSNLDLTTQIDFNKSSMEIPNNILNRLEKLEHRQNRRQLRKTIVKSASDVKSRRFVRVCLMFSIELRHRKMEFLKQTSLPRRIFRQKLYQSDCDIAEYERILTNAYSSIDDHLGYFGTRQLGQSATRTDSAKPSRTLQYFKTEYTSVEFQNSPSTDDIGADVTCPYPVATKSSHLSVELLLRNQIVPCAKCRTKAIQLR